MKKLYAVIGDPIGHSMSPQMHNDLFSYYSIDAHYHPLLVKEHSLKEAVMGLKAIGISGFNVTIPHKTQIIDYLDEVDPLAAQIGAVNTVLNCEGKLIGYNTDGLGFMAGLQKILPNLLDQTILIIGAGGAARSIYFSLAQSKINKIDLYNRTLDKAEQLVNSCPYKVETSVLSLKEAEQNLQKYDVIIQTTSIGMMPNVQSSPISLQHLKVGAIVSDIIYNPLETMLLQEAKKNGAFIQNGVDMFVHQGALAFQCWTGIQPDIERMKKNVLAQLGGKKC